MRRYGQEDLATALRDVGIGPGSRVLVHSALFTLGALRDAPPLRWPSEVLDTLLREVGSDGSVAAPTFTFAFCRGLVYDRQRTPSEGMGVLSEAVRLSPDALRSPHAMQSLAMIGPDAELICAPDPSDAYADDGPFVLLLERGFQLLLLGASVQASSLVHLAELRSNVPYRYHKTFTGTYIDDGNPTQRSYSMFARDLKLDPRLILKPIEDLLASRGEWRSTRLGAGHVHSCDTTQFVGATLELLQADPMALVSGAGTT